MFRQKANDSGPVFVFYFEIKSSHILFFSQGIYDQDYESWTFRIGEPFPNAHGFRNINFDELAASNSRSSYAFSKDRNI